MRYRELKRAGAEVTIGNDENQAEDVKNKWSDSFLPCRMRE